MFVCRAGVVRGFKKNRIGANEHQIEFDSRPGKVEPVKLKEAAAAGWSCEPPRLALYKAAQAAGDDAAAVGRLLRGGADPNETSPGDEDCTPLHVAAQKGHGAVAGALLAGGAAVDAPDKYGHTPLHWAAANGQAAVAELLFQNKASVDAPDEYGRTPLHIAAGNGQAAVAELLLTAGADRTKKTSRGMTPAQTAKAYGHYALAARVPGAADEGADRRAPEPGLGGIVVAAADADRERGVVRHGGHHPARRRRPRWAQQQQQPARGAQAGVEQLSRGPDGSRE
eukprot:SAG22_NODE_2150_length_2929_cov_16.327208_3_plen_283_part_00